MKPNLKIAGEAPPRSPEREALAAAIERRDAAANRLAAIKTAQERAMNSVFDLKDAVDKAIAALDEAKADESRQLVEAFIGGDTAVVSPVKSAAAAVEEANARLATARQMRAALEQEEKTAENDLMWAKNKIDDTVSAAVKTDPAVRQLVADFEAASKTYAELRQAMNVVRRERMPDTPGSWDSVRNWSELPAATAWKAAIEALRADADAELPTN
jgi:predicted  nucleic acid-binding Zn-ribbon protein